MPRVTYVKSARPSQRPRRCHKCHAEIKVGDPYKWFANKVGRSSLRKDFCSGCAIRASDKTTSPHLGALYSAQEEAEDARNALTGWVAPADAAQIATTYAEAVREVGEGYRESADAIEEGFGHPTYQSEELGEKADACESCADDIDSLAGDIEDLPDPDADESEFLDDFDGETDEEGNALDEEEWEEYLNVARDERNDEILDKLDEALNEQPEI